MDGNLAYKEEPRIEWINGKAVAMTPSPTWSHMSVSGTIYNIFFNYLRGKTCRAIQDGFDVHLTEKDIFKPDMMVVCDRSKIKANGVYGAPDLVVEVLSPSTAKRDRTHKKDVYARCGVKEYWLVSPSEKCIEVYRNQNAEFFLYDVYTAFSGWELEQMSGAERAAVVTHFQCSLFDTLDISLNDIFEDLLPE